MVADGAQILNVIQNKATPLLDLLVRESIQNSLDAGRPNEDVFVDFTIKKFDNDNLIKNFQRLKFKEKTNEMLIISDKNTEGLTGSFSYNDSKIGNLLKLVYNVGKPQEQEGAGGSWGYGKTIYYRL